MFAVELIEREKTDAPPRWNCFTAAGAGLTFHGQTIEGRAHRKRRMPHAREMLVTSRRDRSSRRGMQEHGAERGARGAKAPPDNAGGATTSMPTVTHEYHAHRTE